MRRLILLVLPLLLVAACTDSKDDNQVKSASTADVTNVVNDYANRTAALAGDGLELQNAETNPGPCEGRAGELSEEVQSVLGGYQLTLPVEQHHAALQRVRDGWRQQGFEVKQDRDLGNGEGRLTVHNPADDYTITLQSTKPPTMLALLVTSPCYRVTTA